MPFVNKDIEIKPSPGKGLGMFAKRDIPRGKFFLLEKPICVIHKGNDHKGNDPITEEDIQFAYGKLTEDQKKQFCALHDGNRTVTSRIARIYKANTFAMMNQTGTGICLNMSRINHSCVPNSAWSWNEAVGCFAVSAQKKINEGEEIFFCYAGSCDRMTASQRQFLLSIKYDFTCTCIACQPNTAFGYISNMRRQLICELHIRLTGKPFEYLLQSYVRPDGFLVNHLLPNPAKPFTPATDLPTQTVYWFLLGVLREAEGLIDVNTSQSYCFAANTLVQRIFGGKKYFDIRGMRNARSWQLKSVDIMRCCCCPGDPHLLTAERHMQDVEGLCGTLLTKLSSGAAQLPQS